MSKIEKPAAFCSQIKGQCHIWAYFINTIQGWMPFPSSSQQSNIKGSLSANKHNFHIRKAKKHI